MKNFTHPLVLSLLLCVLLQASAAASGGDTEKHPSFSTIRWGQLESLIVADIDSGFQQQVGSAVATESDDAPPNFTPKHAMQEENIQASVTSHAVPQEVPTPARDHNCDKLKVPVSQIKEFMGYDWAKGCLIGLACLHLAVQLYLLPAFLKERNNIHMRSRSPLLTALGCIIGILVSVLSCVGYNMMSEDQYQTVMKMYTGMQNFFFPVLMVPLSLRAWRLVALHKLNQDKSQAAGLMPLELDKTKPGFGSVYEVELLMISKRKEVAESRYLQLGAWCIVLLLLYSLMWYFLGVGDCIAADIQTYNSLAVGVISLVCLVACAARARRTIEAFRIKREMYMACVLNVMLGSVVLAAFGFMRLPQLAGGEYQILAFVVYHFVLLLWLLLSVVLTISLPMVLWKRVERYKQRLIDMEKDFRTRFKDQAYREVFFRYLELEFSSELFLFWEEIEAFRGLGKGSGQRDAARIIYNKYIRDGAMLEVGLDYDLQLESSWNLHSTISSDMYDVAQNAIYVKMLRAYPRYLHFIALNPDVLAEPLHGSATSSCDLIGLDGLASGSRSGDDVGLAVQPEQTTDPATHAPAEPASESSSPVPAAAQP